MTIEVTSLVLSLTSVLFTAITAVFALKAYATVLGMEKSTHQIQWQPIPQEEAGPVGEDLVKEFSDKMYKDVDQEYV